MRLLRVTLLGGVLVPTVAFADGPDGLVAWPEGAAAIHEANAAQDIAEAVLWARSRQAPVRLDAAASVAASCAGPECLAGIGSLAGVGRVVAITVRRDGEGRTHLRVVVVEVLPDVRESGHAERELDAAEGWGHAIEGALAEALPPPPPPPAVGTLILTTTIRGAEVLLDGEPLGRTPLRPRALAPGRYALTVRGEGLPTIETAAEIQAGRNTVIEIRRRSPFPHVAPAEPRAQTKSYAGAILLADLGTLLLAIATESGSVALIGYVAAAPIVHAMVGEPRNGAWSLALRLAAPIAGALLFLPLSTTHASAVEGGALLGAITATLVDAFWLAKTSRTP